MHITYLLKYIYIYISLAVSGPALTLQACWAFLFCLRYSCSGPCLSPLLLPLTQFERLTGSLMAPAWRVFIGKECSQIESIPSWGPCHPMTRAPVAFRHRLLVLSQPVYPGGVDGYVSGYVFTPYILFSFLGWVGAFFMNIGYLSGQGAVPCGCASGRSLVLLSTNIYR